MSQTVPAYRRHKSGQAFVQHKSIPGSGNRLYLGKYGSPQSRRKYKQFLSRLETWEAQPLSAFEPDDDRSIAELAAVNS